jgi:UDP-glucose 4-epimerase
MRPDLAAPFEVTSLRMFSVFGPGQAWDNPYQGVLGIFLGRIRRNEPITIFGDGKQTRDFVFIDDIVNGWIAALNDPKATAGKVFNLGSGRPLSINELAAKALAACGYRADAYDLRHAAARPGEQRRVQADIRAAREAFGWQPRTSFEEGLAATIAWDGGFNRATSESGASTTSTA